MLRHYGQLHRASAALVGQVGSVAHAAARP